MQANGRICLVTSGLESSNIKTKGKYWESCIWNVFEYIWYLGWYIWYFICGIFLIRVGEFCIWHKGSIVCLTFQIVYLGWSMVESLGKVSKTPVTEIVREGGGVPPLSVNFFPLGFLEPTVREGGGG